MVLEVSFCVKFAPTAVFAHEALLLVDTRVDLKVLFLTKLGEAAGKIASVGLCSLVQMNVSFEADFTSKHLIAAWVVACEPFLGMHHRLRSVL